MTERAELFGVTFELRGHALILGNSKKGASPFFDKHGSASDYLDIVCASNSDCVAAGAGSTCTPVILAGVTVGLCAIDLK
jgi:hypothetical protein